MPRERPYVTVAVERNPVLRLYWQDGKLHTAWDHVEYLFRVAAWVAHHSLGREWRIEVDQDAMAIAIVGPIGDAMYSLALGVLELAARTASEGKK
jgi:hypothetical protein